MISYRYKFVNNLRRFERKRILILGFGREGRDTFLFLRKLFPNKTFGIADQNPSLVRLNPTELEKVRLHLGKRYLEALKKYDVIIKSPGIPPKVIAPYLTALAPDRKQVVTSATEIFLHNCPGIIIGVTGTKGKSTTSSMIHKIIKKNPAKKHPYKLKNVGVTSEIDRKFYLVGNIGIPALFLLEGAKPNDVFVYEMSSHQLHGLKKSPDIAVFLNIFPEHLDYYRNFKEYARAKANICLWQKKSDYLVYNTGDKLVAKFAKKSKAKKIQIKGRYYHLDRAAAIAVAEIFGISRKKAERSLKDFKLLPHRLEKVGTFRGITFYNDSLATAPQPTMEALNFLGNKVETLVAGGYDRGLDFSELAKRIQKNGIKTLILFPPSGLRLAQTLQKNTRFKSSISIFLVSNMREALKIAFEHTGKGKICLLSPASPSFGIFKDYKDRGEQFKRRVKSY